jgi:multiple sugar transport system substrate-binding protein
MARWMRAILAWGSAATLVLALAACSKEPSAAQEGEESHPERNNKKVIIEMSVWGMPWENDLYREIYIPAFEAENPNVEVKFYHFPRYNERLLTLYRAGESPDVMRQNIVWGGLYMQKGTNRPLDNYIDGPDGVDRSDFLQILWDRVTFDGKTYGLPQDINMIGLFYNKDIFDNAGIAYPDASWTWDDLERVAKRLTKVKNKRVEIFGYDAIWYSSEFMCYFLQAGGKIWSEDRQRCLINSAAGVEALRFWKSMIYEFHLARSGDMRGGTAIGPDKFFEMGKTAMYVDGTWSIPAIKRNAPDLRFGVAPLPHFRRAATIGTSCYWAISKQSKHPDEAWKLIKFMNSTENLLRYWRVLWVAPPARWSALRDPRFRQITGLDTRIPGLPEEEFDEKCGWILYCLENGITTTEQIHPRLGDLMTELQIAIDKVLVMRSTVDPQDALDACVERVNKIVAEDAKSRN